MNDNPRVTTFTYREPPSVEPNWYSGRLYCVEIVNHKTWGERWRWVFTLPGAGEDGKDVTVSKWTSPYLSKKSMANDIVEALTGRRVTKDNPDLDFAELQDKPCFLEIGRDDEGYNTVKTVSRPLPQPATAAQPAAVATAPNPASLDPEYAAFLAAKKAAAAAQAAPTDLPPAPADVPF